MEKREEHLIVGLGNPDAEYSDTRHNLGFACVRMLAERLGAKVEGKRWRSLVGRSEAHGVWVVLPQRYMNLSGEAVNAAMRDTGVAASQVWVVPDALALALCRLRLPRGP